MRAGTARLVLLNRSTLARAVVAAVVAAAAM